MKILSQIYECCNHFIKFLFLSLGWLASPVAVEGVGFIRSGLQPEKKQPDISLVLQSSALLGEPQDLNNGFNVNISVIIIFYRIIK